LILSQEYSYYHQLQNRNINKYYKALVLGVPVKTGERVIDEAIGHHHSNKNKMMIDYDNGKEARTIIQAEKIFNTGKRQYSLLKIKLITGRFTHFHYFDIDTHFIFFFFPGPTKFEFTYPV
jgi:23S rRNA-/tRNA-specific pseudouridylate synthase